MVSLLCGSYSVPAYCIWTRSLYRTPHNCRVSLQCGLGREGTDYAETGTLFHTVSIYNDPLLPYYYTGQLDYYLVKHHF